MSSFICEYCGAEILDTPNGYITECEHYPLENFDKPVKTKRRKKITICRDRLRQRDHCGICGSANIAEQGVVFCHTHGYEEPYMRYFEDWLFNKDPLPTLPCRCRRYYSIYRMKCLDCGAVQGPICPACKKTLWGKGMNRHCNKCGFTSQEKEVKIESEN